MGISSYIIRINYISKADAQNNTVYFLFNGHGDVVQTVDEVGKVQNQYDYDIWDNPTLTVETSSNAIRYAGEFMDSETGRYYLRARYYDTYTGRFISEDSYWGEDENLLSLNLYTYCGANDPIRYTDPTGHAVAKIGTKGDTIKAIQEDLKKLKLKGLIYQKRIRRRLEDYRVTFQLCLMRSIKRQLQILQKLKQQQKEVQLTLTRRITSL